MLYRNCLIVYPMINYGSSDFFCKRKYRDIDRVPATMGSVVASSAFIGFLLLAFINLGGDEVALVAHNTAVIVGIGLSLGLFREADGGLRNLLRGGWFLLVALCVLTAPFF